VAENSPAATIGKFGIGLGAGFGLYWLIRNLGYGAGGGFGFERPGGGGLEHFWLTLLGPGGNCGAFCPILIPPNNYKFLLRLIS
jgi:hypothetical protein